MDSTYPNGNYVFKLYAIHDGIRTATNALNGGYPTTPRVNNFESTQFVDSTKDFLLTWDAFAGGTATDFVRIDIGVTNTPDYGQPGAFNGTNKSFLIKAGTLYPDQTFYVSLLFAKVTALNTNAYPGVPGISAFYKRTDLTLSTLPAPQPLEILTSFLPYATQAVFYSTLLQADGGQPPYSWSLLAPLPGGFGLSAGGTLAGTPTISGTTNVSIRVTDATNGTASAIIPFTIVPSTNNPAPTLTAPARLANGQFQFSFNTTPGVNYTILYSTTLTNWNALVSFNGSGGPITIIDPNAPSNMRRFYRVKIGL